jgi:hypothetical protein
MARKRYYRRRRSPASQIIRDTVKTANQLSWRKCLVLGAFGFVIFYYLVPSIVGNYISNQAQNPFFPAIEAILVPKLRFLRLAGIGIALICVFFAVRNFHTQQQMSSQGLIATGFFARLLARILD